MKKLNLAIIGQGRSGKNIHGQYYLSVDNKYYDVKYVVDENKQRRDISLERYKGCKVFASYKELLNCKDIDLVVNASFSDMHYSITRDLLENGFNVLVEKPFARSRFECDSLIKTAKDNNVLLAIFHNTQFAPFYLEIKRILDEQKLGRAEQISIRYNNFARRWDWQTLQKRLAGSAYNTGPHPICMALGFLDFDKNAQVVYSKLASTPLTSGDGDDYVKILLSAPDKPLIDIEISSLDAYSDYNIKVQGSKGTLKATTADYQYKYIIDGENQPRVLNEGFMHDGQMNPIFCGEKLIMHEESGKYNGDAFGVGTAAVYEDVYKAIVTDSKLTVTPQMAASVISVIEKLHADNPLEVKF